MTLVDTSAWIEFLRKQGEPSVRNRVAAYLDLGAAAYCGPVELELLVGARPAELAAVRAALRFATLLDFHPSCWRAAAGLEKRLRGAGVTVPRDDILVAVVAIHHRVAVYARDPHFALMRDKAGVQIRLD